MKWLTCCAFAPYSLKNSGLFFFYFIFLFRKMNNQMPFKQKMNGLRRNEGAMNYQGWNSKDIAKQYYSVYFSRIVIVLDLAKHLQGPIAASMFVSSWYLPG